MIENYRECRRCHESLPLTIEFFYKNGPNNFQYYCKQCQAILKKEWAGRNRDKVNQYVSAKRDKHPELREYNQLYCRDYYEKHKEEIRQKQRDKRIANHDEVIKKQREYRAKNREYINARKREYEQSKKIADPKYKLIVRARNTIRKSFSRRGAQKCVLAETITGLDSKRLCDYLINTFYETYGRKWDGSEIVHIDHIVPISSANTEEEIIKLCHYSNLRLITAEDNMRKQNKTDYVIGG